MNTLINKARKVCFGLSKYILLAGLTFISTQSFAQSLTGLSEIKEESMTINSINYKIEGPLPISQDAISAHVNLRKGMQFNQDSLDKSIRALYSTGLYDVINAVRTSAPNGDLDINFTIIPKYRISQIVFKGNQRYKAKRLQDEILSQAGTVLDEIKAKRDADKLKAFYQKKGYSLAKINYSIERNDEVGRGVIIFDIEEGGDIAIQNIRFVGDPAIEKSYGFWGRLGYSMWGEKKPDELNSIELTRKMKTDTWIPVLSHLTDNGRFKDSEFEADLETLRKIYRNHGYLDVVIDETKVKFEFPDADNPGDMDIVIEIDPKKQYRVGEVSFKNNKLFTSEELMPVFGDYKLTTGNIFSPEKVNALTEKLKDFYGSWGYIDTVVRALRNPNVETGDIDLVIDIIESGKFYVESINIQGNSKTKSEVILRELAFSPGDIFDLTRMKVSEARLKETRFFDEVSLSAEATNIPNRRNLRVVVKEGRTGNLTFGAGFSTVESLVATVELTQSNFDYTNYDNYFQGAGQKFRMLASVGLESNQVLLSFEEPWVFNRQLALGIDLYRTESDYYSDYYSEMRLGASTYLRKRLFELVEAKISYKFELVDIYDVDQTLIDNGVLQEDRGDIGSRTVSQASLVFLRDSRDSYMTPTKGTRFEFIQDFAGGPLQGETDFYRVEARLGWWIPTFDFGKQVLSIVGRTGSVYGFGGEDVPYFEKYFLGGGYNMRGFEYRKVGAVDSETEEPYGGNTFAFASIEYSIEIFNPVRFAVFYDIGFVNADSWDWDPSGYNSDFGVGLRIMLMGAPMRIDMGFPITTSEYNDDGMQFNFSFGTVF